MTQKDVLVAYLFDKDIFKSVVDATNWMKAHGLPIHKSGGHIRKCNYVYPVNTKKKGIPTQIIVGPSMGVKKEYQMQPIVTKVPGRIGRPPGAKDKTKRKPRSK